MVVGGLLKVLVYGIMLVVYGWIVVVWIVYGITLVVYIVWGMDYI